MTLHQAEGLIGRRSQRRPGPARRTLGVVSGKGGVGKSALAANLATAASGAGARTLLIDGDAGLANADLLLGMTPRHDLDAWCAGRAALDELACAGPGGLDLLLAGTRAEAHRRLQAALRGAPAEGLEGLLAAYDLVVLDLGAGLGPSVLELAERCDPVWLVATPEPTSLADAYATTKQLWARRPELAIELVVNRAGDRASGERTHQALARLTRRFLSRDLPLRSVLPEDAAMIAAVARQRPVLLDAPRSGIARRLALLAESLVGDVLHGDLQAETRPFRTASRPGRSCRPAPLSTP